MALESVTTVSERRLCVKNTFISVECDDDDGPWLFWYSESKAECSLQSSRRCSILSDGLDAKRGAPSECDTEEGTYQDTSFCGSEGTAEKPSWADIMDDDECGAGAAKEDDEETSVQALDQPPAPPQAPSLGAGVERVSLGGVYHPHLCNQPCRWVASGECAAGADCTFCHCAHDGRRSSYLDKRNRESVRKLSGAAFASLLTPALIQKVGELDMALQADAVLKDWVRAVELANGGDASHTKLKAAEARRLTACLEGLTVNVLCRTFAAYSDDNGLAQLMKDLLASLQSFAAGHSTSGA